MPYARLCPQCGDNKPVTNVRDGSVRCRKCGFKVDIPWATVENLFFREWNYAVTHLPEDHPTED